MKPKGLSIVELLVIMVVIFVVSLLVLPVVRPRNCGCDGATSNCISNMKMIGRSIAQYTQDADETFPYSGARHDWPDESLVYFPQIIMPYAKNKDLLKCPNDRFAEHGALYEALRQADRAPSTPKLPTTYYYFYDFYHPDIGAARIPPCSPGPVRATKMAEVIHPGSKAMMVCILSDQYVFGSPHGFASPSDLLLFVDGHAKLKQISSLVDTPCFPGHNRDWSGVGASDLK